MFGKRKGDGESSAPAKKVARGVKTSTCDKWVSDSDKELSTSVFEYLRLAEVRATERRPAIGGNSEMRGVHQIRGASEKQQEFQRGFHRRLKKFEDVRIQRSC
eukprot:scpid100033/ scgid10813/ 